MATDKRDHAVPIDPRHGQEHRRLLLAGVIAGSVQFLPDEVVDLYFNEIFFKHGHLFSTAVTDALRRGFVIPIPDKTPRTDGG